MSDIQPVMAPDITGHETQEIDEANASGRTPVVFVHGLWLLPSSWDRWETLFKEAGYATLAPGWPDDPEAVGEAKAHPEVFAGKSIKEVADHFEHVIRKIEKVPGRGHSLTIDSGWREVAETSLAFIQRFVQPEGVADPMKVGASAG